MSVDFSGASGGGGFVDPLAGYNPTPYTPPSSGGGGPFIDWESPVSILTSPVRAAVGAARQGAGLVEAATRGIPAMGAALGEEGWHNLQAAVGDVTHPGVQSLGLLGGAPGLFKAATGALPALGGKGTPFPLQPGQTPLPDQPTGFGPFLAQVGKSAPATAGLVGGAVNTGTDVEQLARAAGNTLLPGQPLGSDVGQLGSGPGLLGNTNLAMAAKKGGGGVAAPVLNDVTNLSMLGGPVESLVGAAAKDAAAEAAARAAAATEATKAAGEATTAAEQNVDQAAQQYERAVQARSDAAQAAQSGHPVAAAQYQAADQAVQSAGQALQQAQQAAEQIGAEHGGNVDLAQQAADQAQARADALNQRLGTVKLVNNLGSKAAASPFAPLEYGVPRLLGAAAPLAHAIVGSDLGQTFLQPVLDRAKGVAEQVAANRSVGNQRDTAQLEKLNADQQLRQGFEATQAPLPTDEATVRRGPLGLFGTKTVPVPDADAAAVATMAQTGEGAHLANLVREFGPERATQLFDQAMTTEGGEHQYTPEQLHLATEVFGNANTADISERAAQIREAIPAVKQAYAAPGGALDVQNRAYSELRGEAGVPSVRPEPGPGAFEQVTHNLEGTGPRIEGLQQWQDAQARYAAARGQGEKALERAGKQLVKAQERLGGAGLSEAERANPRLLFDRLYAAPTEAARAVADQGAHVWDAMAQSPEKGLAALGARVRDGRLSPDAAIQPLADQILKLARKDPDTLSPTALTLVEEARQRGMGDVGREARVANVTSATAPAQRVGVGVERTRAGAAAEAAGAAHLERADRMYGEAMDKMGAPTRDASGKVAAAGTRVAAAAAKLADLTRRVAAAAGTVHEAETDLFAHAGVSRREVADSVLEIRRQIKADFAAQADAIDEELSRQGVPAMKPPEQELRRTVIRKAGAEQKGQVVRRMMHKDDELGESFYANNIKGTPLARDTRYFRPDGLSVEDLVNAWRSAHGVGGQETGATESASEILGKWLDAVQTARRLREAARVAADKGWDPAQHLEAVGEVKDRLNQMFGPEVAEALGRSVVQGHPNVVAAEIEGHLNEILGNQHIEAAQADRTAAVRRALEADRQNEEARGTVGARAGRNSLDTIGKAMYDRQVVEDQARVQGQVLGQRQAQLGGAAAAGAERARAQGQSEGALLGGSRQLERQATGELTQGERAQASGKAIVGQAPELAQQAAQRVAGPVGEMYREVGKREQSVADATARYMKEQRALDRLDEGLAAKQRELEASVEAAPRAMRPVLELGERLRDILTPLADHADAEFGAGAGDVYRNAAAEATILSAETMGRYGIDPQFLIGEREGPQPLGVARSVEARSGGPIVGRTGQREAGIGLKHATDYETLYRQARARAFQQIDNVTGQRIIDGTGGRLEDLLRERGVAHPEEIPQAQLGQTLKDAGLTAWDLSDRRGGLLPQQQLTLDTPVVPTAVWRAWQRYQETPGPQGFAGTMLRGYDKTTQALKRIIRLSPRWQVAITAGHAVMAMTGAGIDPATYFGHDIPTAIRLDRLTRQGGPQTPEDIAFVRGLPPQVQQALAEGHGVPGAVRNRGFVREEFPTSEPNRTLVGTRPMKVQSALDNINRTAVWLHQLERGLDARGLADFRTAFPDLAHLSDAQIQNEGAIRLSIRTMGDYLNRTPFERQAISRVIFFYPWLRHITKLAMNTAIHDPLRTAWILHLGAMFDPGPGPVGFLSTSYNAGTNKWITPPSWNPFMAVVPFTDNPLGSVNPMVNTAVAGATGFNLSTGKPVTRPYFEPGGRLSASELANYGVNQIPFMQQARESLPALLGGTPVARYQTGQPIILKSGEIPSNETQWLGSNSLVPEAAAPWMSYLGLPLQRDINTDQIIARQDATARKNAAAARKYSVRRALLAGG